LQGQIDWHVSGELRSIDHPCAEARRICSIERTFRLAACVLGTETRILCRQLLCCPFLRFVFIDFFSFRDSRDPVGNLYSVSISIKTVRACFHLDHEERLQAMHVWYGPQDTNQKEKINPLTYMHAPKFSCNNTACLSESFRLTHVTWHVPPIAWPSLHAGTPSFPTRSKNSTLARTS